MISAGFKPFVALVRHFGHLAYSAERRTNGVMSVSINPRRGRSISMRMISTPLTTAVKAPQSNRLRFSPGGQYATAAPALRTEGKDREDCVWEAVLRGC